MKKSEKPFISNTNVITDDKNYSTLQTLEDLLFTEQNLVYVDQKKKNLLYTLPLLKITVKIIKYTLH